MSSTTATIVKAISAFVATNLDDIIILMLFFSRLKSGLKAKHIVAGQYLGFLVIIVASLPGFFGGLIVPKSWIGLLGLVPVAIGLMTLFKPKEQEQEIQLVTEDLNKKTVISSLLHPQTYQMAGVTFANGGDNISIYVSLFASLNWVELLITLTTFLVMVALWCGLGFWLVSHKHIAQFIEKFGHRFIPFIFIALGIYIMAESGTFNLLQPS